VNVVVVLLFFTVNVSLYPLVFEARFAAVAPSGVTFAVPTGIVCCPHPTPWPPSAQSCNHPDPAAPTLYVALMFCEAPAASVSEVWLSPVHVTLVEVAQESVYVSELELVFLTVKDAVYPLVFIGRWGDVAGLGVTVTPTILVVLPPAKCTVEVRARGTNKASVRNEWRIPTSGGGRARERHAPCQFCDPALMSTQ
jgi:hypothetical protein